MLELFLNSFTFYVHLLCGHHPPECTGAHELRSCDNISKCFSWNVSNFVSQCLFECIYIFKAPTVHLTFQLTPQKRIRCRYAQWTSLWHITEIRNHLRGNKWRSAAMLITAVWKVAPSCWNHQLWFGGSFWAINSLIIFVKHCSVTAMVCSSSESKK